MAQVFQGMPKNDIGGSIGNALGAIGGQTLGQKMAAMHQQKQIEKKWEGLTPLLLQMGQTPESIKQYKASGSDPTPLVPFFKIAAQNSQDQNYGNALNDYYGNSQQQGSPSQGNMQQSPRDQELSPTGQMQKMLPNQDSQQSQEPTGNRQLPTDEEVEEIIKKRNLGGKDAEQLRTKHRANVDIELKRNKESRQISKEDRQRFESERNYHTKTSDKAIEKAHSLRDSLVPEEQALNLFRQALKGDVGPFSVNDLSKYFPQLLNKEGAALKAAQKEILLGGITGLKGRPNQWIEQRISEQAPSAGLKREANQTLYQALEATSDKKKAWLNNYNKLSEKYEDELGYLPKRFEDEVNRATESDINKIDDKLAYRLREIDEEGKSDEQLGKLKKVTSGTPLTIRMANVLMKRFGNEEEAMRKAIQLGYTLPNEQDVEDWNGR